MKRGRRGGRGAVEGGGGEVVEGEAVVEGGEGEVVEVVEEVVEGGEGEGEEVVGGETRSIIRAILSSSSGQMSGQCVNPK